MQDSNSVGPLDLLLACKILFPSSSQRGWQWAETLSRTGARGERTAATYVFLEVSFFLVLDIGACGRTVLPLYDWLIVVATIRLTKNARRFVRPTKSKPSYGVSHVPRAARLIETMLTHSIKVLSHEGIDDFYEYPAIWGHPPVTVSCTRVRIGSGVQHATYVCVVPSPFSPWELLLVVVSEAGSVGQPWGGPLPFLGVPPDAHGNR